MLFDRYIMKMFGKGYQRLNADDEQPDFAIKTSVKCLHRSRNIYRNLALILFVSNVVLASLYIRVSTRSCSRSRLVYCKNYYRKVERDADELTVPSDGHVTYEKRRLWRDIENNVYAGSARKEHDDAWKRLIEREPSSTLRFAIARF
jgi:hypothetical protein